MADKDDLYYFPSCNFPKWFPETAPKLDEYMLKRFQVKPLPCCHNAGASFPIEATALTVCLSCALMVRERLGEQLEQEVSEKSVFELLAEDDQFPWPDLKGEEITLQDCFRAKDNKKLQDAVRKCLKRMNATIVELPENRENSRYDGRFLLRDCSADSKRHAPSYFSNVFPKYVQYLSKDEQDQRLVEHAQSIKTLRVVCYCNTCTTGLKDAGKNAVHLAELMFRTK